MCVYLKGRGKNKTKSILTSTYSPAPFFSPPQNHHCKSGQYPSSYPYIYTFMHTDILLQALFDMTVNTLYHIKLLRGMKILKPASKLKILDS